jgi:hypothetical protein
MHGRGIYNWPDGAHFEGEYKNNIKEGIGNFKWSNGRIFEGPFVNGKFKILNFYFNNFIKYIIK